MISRPVNVERTFMRSMAVTVSVSACILASAEGHWYPAALTPLVALLTYTLVDRRGVIRLPIMVANILGLIAFAAMIWEFYGNTLLGKLLSGAHLLVYISWVVLLLQKGIRQFWWLAALSVLQVAVASVLTNDSSFGFLLICLLLLMLWTLSVFTLYRGRVRIAMSSPDVEDSLNPLERYNAEDSLNAAAIESSSLTVRNGLQVDAEEPWIGWRFRAIVGFAFFASLFVGAITFIVFPRIWVPGSPLSGLAAQAQGLASQTGFTENVQLGDIGQIMQSDARVLQFQISRRSDGTPVSADDFANALRMDEILFRGNALGNYRRGRWTSGASQGRSIGDLPTDRRFVRDPAESDLQMRIIQDPPVQTFAFAPVPVQHIKPNSRETQILQGRLSSTLTYVGMKREEQSEPFEFTAWYKTVPNSQKFHSPGPVDSRSDLISEVLDYFRTPSRYEEFQRYYAFQWCITRGLEKSLPEVARLSQELCTDQGRALSDRQAVQKVMSWLTSSGRFQYSLNATFDDASLDPVEDFLINRRTGHCEYFASACALLLQAAGVPARVVNGYKGYEQNSVSGRFEVKQKHAHAWVEAFVEGHWETLDPTPAAAREEEVTRKTNLTWWQDLRLAFNDLWLDTVERMSPQRQEAMVRPWLTAAQKKITEIRRQGVWKLLQEFWTEVVLQPSKWFSWRTGFVTFVLLLGLGLIIQRNPSSWLAGKLAAVLPWLRSGNAQNRSVVRFYETFCDVCRKHGLKLPSSQTAQENAQLAAHHFATALQTEHDKQLPHRIATAFNQVRFGQTQLAPEAVDELRSDVSRLSELLKAT